MGGQSAENDVILVPAQYPGPALSPVRQYQGPESPGSEWRRRRSALARKRRLPEAQVGKALDPEDVPRELPLSDVVLLQELSLQLELLLQQRMGQSHLGRSSKPGRQPGSAVSVRLPGT